MNDSEGVDDESDSNVELVIENEEETGDESEEEIERDNEVGEDSVKEKCDMREDQGSSFEEEDEDEIKKPTG